MFQYYLKTFVINNVSNSYFSETKYTSVYSSSYGFAVIVNGSPQIYKDKTCLENSRFTKLLHFICFETVNPLTIQLMYSDGSKA